MGCGSCFSKSKNEEEERKNGCLPCCKSEESSSKKKTKRKRSWNPLGCLTCRAKRVMCCCSFPSCCADKPSVSKEKKHKPFCCGSKSKSSESKEKKSKCCCINKPSKSEGRTIPSESRPVINKPSEPERRTKPSEPRPVITKEVNRDSKSPEEKKKKKKKKSKKESKRGSRLGCLHCLVCGCCRKPKSEDDNNRKTSDEGVKSAISSKDGNNKKAFDESKEGGKSTCLSCCKGKGLRNCFCCVKSENKKPSRKKKEPRKGSQLAFLVHNISFKSDGDKQRTQAEEILRIGNGNIAARVFHFRELAAATKNFKAECLLGEGGFGRVYKGKLEDSNQIVAVKQLDRNGFQGNREFLIEVLMLSLLHHQNLVKLLGYCADGDQRILVYEYMPFGSLEDRLLARSPNKKPLDWHTRMKIALGSAKGLEYLHDIASPPVIYRDFKASNILLDGEYNPKLSDFGLAKLGPMGDKSHVSTRVMGTYGYCAPEYALTGKLTKMSDVYSFGVVFLEMITGRRAIDISKPTNEQQLVYWAGPLFRDKTKFEEMADPSLLGKYPTKGLYQALAVASMCLQEDANIRPRISDVVTALEYLCVSSDESTSGLKESIPMEVATPVLVSEMSTDGIEVVNKKDLSQSQSNSEDEICSTWRETEQGVDIT